jgi:hypothetical protein
MRRFPGPWGLRLMWWIVIYEIHKFVWFRQKVLSLKRSLLSNSPNHCEKDGFVGNSFGLSAIESLTNLLPQEVEELKWRRSLSETHKLRWMRRNKFSIEYISAVLDVERNLFSTFLIFCLLFFFFQQTEQFTVLWILFAIIVFGNTAVLVTLFVNKSRKSRMNFFIKHLAIAGNCDFILTAMLDATQFKNVERCQQQKESLRTRDNFTTLRIVSRSQQL